DVALGGKALARVEGRVVFVDRGLPGDRVSARVTKASRRFAEARLTSVEAPSPSRVPPRCVHVERCGGCRRQELPYEAQLLLKERQVRETLQHLGGIAEPPVRAIVPAPAAWAYRNKMEFSFAPDESGRPLLGLHERGTFDRVFELRECWLPSPLAVEIVRFPRGLADSPGWPPITRRGTRVSRASSPCATSRTSGAARSSSSWRRPPAWPARGASCRGSMSGRAAWPRCRRTCAR